MNGVEKLTKFCKDHKGAIIFIVGCGVSFFAGFVVRDVYDMISRKHALESVTREVLSDGTEIIHF